MKTAVLLDGVPSSLVVICGRFGRSIFLCLRKETDPESGWKNFHTNFGKYVSYDTTSLKKIILHSSC